MRVADRSSDGTLRFSFERIDQVLDAILAVGMRPFVEISFMCEALASGPETIFWWRGNITLPRDRSEWCALIDSLGRHLLSRYGEEEIRTWYFEVWNEPDLPQFFKGTQDDYFTLYRDTALTLKKVSPVFRTGGPATSEHRWIDSFLQFCDRTGTPLDFVSTHGYCVEGALDEHGKRSLVVPPCERMFTDGVKRTAASVRQSFRPDLEIHYTEWSASYSSRDPIHDHYVSGAFLLARIFETRHLVHSLSYWAFSDHFEELGPPEFSFHGGFGLLTIDDIPKPTFFLFSFLAALRKRELPSSEPGCWMTCDDEGIAALLWLERSLPPGALNKRLFATPFPPERTEERSISFTSLSAGRWQVKRSRVGYLSNDACSYYLAGGPARRLSAEEAASLRARLSEGSEPEEEVDVDGSGTLRLTISLREGDVVLLEVIRTIR